jgi:hypothetical protein
MFGILIRNSNGDILVDNEHVHPKLYQIYPLICTAAGTFDVPFQPTSKFVFVTAHSKNTLCNVVGVKRTNGLWSFARVATAGAGNVNVRIYEL